MELEHRRFVTLAAIRATTAEGLHRAGLLLSAGAIHRAVEARVETRVPLPMTVRAEHIALRDLRLELRTRTPERSNVELLRQGIAMMELERVTGVPAIDAGGASEVSRESAAAYTLSAIETALGIRGGACAGSRRPLGPVGRRPAGARCCGRQKVSTRGRSAAAADCARHRRSPRAAEIRNRIVRTSWPTPTLRKRDRPWPAVPVSAPAGGFEPPTGGLTVRYATAASRRIARSFYPTT